MDSMEREYRRLFRDVSPCVVLVEQVGRIDNFCIGSVISQGDKTIILTQSKILNSPVMSVRFFDGFKQQATVLLKKEKLGVLMTNRYPKCKEVEFFEGNIDHIYAASIAPASKSSVYNIPGFIIEKSLDVGSQGEAEAGSSNTKHHFTFSCLYGDSGANKVSRLISGPIFNMDGKVVGIVIGDMRYKLPYTYANRKGYAQMGYNLKIGMSSAHLQSCLTTWAKHNNWKAGLQKMAVDEHHN